jgi:hypothetical protein
VSVECVLRTKNGLPTMNFLTENLVDIRAGLTIEQGFGGTGFQPVLAQAKACGYILQDTTALTPL